MKEIEKALTEMNLKIAALDNLDANQHTRETAAMLCAIDSMANVVRALIKEARAADKAIYELSNQHP